MTISGLRDSIQTSFEKYAAVRNNLIEQLNHIFFGDESKYYIAEGHISLADFIKKAVIILEEKEAELKAARERLRTAEAELEEAEETGDGISIAEKASAKTLAEGQRDAAIAARDAALKKGFGNFSDCDESTAAYKFYARQIIDEINKLTDYINEAQKILSKWAALSGGNLSSLVHADVVRLECLDKFCSEIHQKFGTRYYYDFDEDNWKLAEDDYSGAGDHVQVGDSYDSYDDLYDVKVKCDANGAAQKTLDCFNELNLLDRLKYIKVYFDIKETGTTNYVFPGSKEYGFPCVGEKDMDQTDVRIANLEKFYLGYLIDRDGPINAFCSLNEIKVRALQESLNELQKRIKALNVYLEFINRGLTLLQLSQKDKPSGLPEGTVIALTYLCGQKMYNLFEYNGVNYLVIPSVTTVGTYVCVQADEAGMRFLLGDGGGLTNGNCQLKGLNGNRLWQVCSKENKNKPTRAVVGDLRLLYSSGKLKEGGYYGMIETSMPSETFSLPKELTEVAPINPKSVKYYEDYSNVHKEGDDNYAPHDATISSWTDAFNKKTEYINAAIDTVNTDIDQIRDKINTYQSQATTFRNRAHDVYVNTVRRIKA